MDSPESPPTPSPEEEAERQREDAGVSLLASIGATALGTFFAVNTVSLARGSWEIEGPAVVVSGLFAAGTTGVAAWHWAKFHRLRDRLMGSDNH